MSDHDLVFLNASVVDGSGTSAFIGHVAVTGERITAVSYDRDDVPSGRETIDLDGLTLSPGFIDMHSHSDMAVIEPGDLAAKIAQGVTTEVAGQDGLGLAPMHRGSDIPLPRLVEILYGDVNAVDVQWETVGEYLDLLDRGAPTNSAYLVPHGTVRALVMGYDEREPTADELAEMCAEVRKGMIEGAVGMSTGLGYAPGSFAKRDELVALCTVVAELGGFHDTHQRSYGRGCYEGYEEVIEISEASGCSLQLAHAEIDFPENLGRDRDLMRLIDDATARGVDVTFDILPYDQAATMLAAFLPGWVHAKGPDGMLELLRDPAARERIRIDMEEVGSEGAYFVPMGWDVYEIAARSSSDEFIGMRITEAAAARGVSPSDLYFDVLVEDELNAMSLMHMGHEDHVRRMMQHRAFMACSDGGLRGNKPHPRGWGTYPRYLGKYVRELGLLRLEECVAHMTSVPATRLRLRDRGQIAEGWFADLVVFDAATVADTATYDVPRSAPVGIPHVLVNGKFAVRDGEVHEVRSGRAMRRGRDTYIPAGASLA